MSQFYNLFSVQKYETFYTQSITKRKAPFGSIVVQYASYLLTINMKTKTPKSAADFLAALIQ